MFLLQSTFSQSYYTNSNIPGYVNAYKSCKLFIMYLMLKSGYCSLCRDQATTWKAEGFWFAPW
jgi:hypothetical protein